MRVGFARAPITPVVRMELVGYDYPDRVFDPERDEPLDPLYLRVLAIEDDAQLVLLIVADLCVIPAGMAKRIRRTVRRALQREDACVMVCATHTHSAPLACSEEDVFEIPQLGQEGLLEDSIAYFKYVENRCVEASLAACRDLSQASVGYSEFQADMAYNRRVPTAEGIRHCWNPKQQTHLKPGPHPCPTCPLLVFERNGKVPILFAAPGIHPVCLGKESKWLSADWPGYAHQQLERAGYASVICQGASAEVHPFRATEEVAGAERAVGDVVAAGIIDACSKLRTVQGLTAVESVEHSIHESSLRLSYGTIAGVPMATVPGEWFARDIIDLQQAQEYLPLILTLTDGWAGYFPNAEVWEEGGYEVEVAKKMGITPQHTAAIQQLIHVVARSSA